MSMEAWELVTLGIDAGLVAIFYALYRGHNKKAKQIESAVDLSIDKALTSKILNNGKTVDYGCIRGNVGADGHLKSRFSDETGVIRQYTQVEHISRRENGIWRDVRKVMTDAVDKIPFYITNPDNKRAKVYVNEPLEAHYLGDDLKVTYSHFTPAEQNFLGRGLDRLFGDVTKGIQESEEMLPLGTCLLGLGKITAENGKIIIEPPTNDSMFILTTQTKKELLKSVSRTRTVFKSLAVIFGVLGSGLLAFVIFKRIKRYYDERRENEMFAELREHMRVRFRRQNNPAVGDNPDQIRRGVNAELGQQGGAEGDDVMEGRTCVICLTNLRNVVLLDCGHICVCLDCSQILPVPRKCPVCRAHILRIVPLYNS